MTTIIWDWDATLADTYHTINAAYTHTFRQLGLEQQILSYAKIKQITSTQANKDTLGFIFKQRKGEAGQFYYDYFRQHHLAEIKPMPYAKEILEYCHRQKFVSYLFSNKTNISKPELNKEPFLKQEVKSLGFEKYFCKVIGAGELKQDKPHPLACYEIFGSREHLPSRQEALFVIGDGRADIKVASVFKQAGLQVTSILYNETNPENLTADYLISDLRQIKDIIKV